MSTKYQSPTKRRYAEAANWQTAIDEIDAAARKTTVYAPVPEPKAHKDEPGKPVPQDKHEPKPGDSPAVAAWRARMATAEAKAVYRERGATAEWVNADARTHRTLTQVVVRGLEKVHTLALWAALAHNLIRRFVS